MGESSVNTNTLSYVPLDNAHPSAPENQTPEPPPPSQPTYTEPMKPVNDPVSPQSALERTLIGGFAVATTASIFLWFMVGAGFPWFIYIMYGVGIVECIIYAVKTKNSFFANWTIYATTNAMLFLTFLACGGGYPWFIFPAFSMAILPVSQYIYRKVEVRKVRWLYIHGAIYALINSMLFFTWMADSLYNPYPWFIFSWCGWGIPLLIQYNYAIMQNKKKLLVYVAADIGVMIAIAIRFALGAFSLIFFLLGAVAVLAVIVFRKKGYAIHCIFQKQAPVLPTTQVPSTEATPTTGRVHIEVAPDGTIMHPAPQAPMPVGASIPQVPPQYPYGYQVPAGPMYYQSNSSAPVYYAYFPSQGGMYPTLTSIPTVPQGGQMFTPTMPSSPVAVPQAPQSPQVPSESNNDAVLNGNANGDDVNKDEEGYLLRNSPSRSYSNQN